MCKKKKCNSDIYNLDPKLWKSPSNLARYPYDKWVKFKDISDEVFYTLWSYIEQCPNLILNEDGTAFKKVKYVNFNRLNQDVFPYNTIR